GEAWVERWERWAEFAKIINSRGDPLERIYRAVRADGIDHGWTSRCACLGWAASTDVTAGIRIPANDARYGGNYLAQWGLAEVTFEQGQLLRSLVEGCAPAAFGRRRKTGYDRAARDALQIKAEGGAFSVLHFDPVAAGVLEQIRHELVPHVPEPLTAELYALNVYATGGHFVPHKDTPRGSDMLGTLVVCLPAQFSNGAFVVKHRGVFQTYDWGHAIREQAEPTRIHWAAFFGDV